MRLTFEEVFTRATGFPPYPYQKRIGESSDWPDVINIETGLGKTLGVVLPWIYKRRFAEEPVRKQTPRRLIICLPTRVLVEQTYDVAASVLKRLDLHESDESVPARADGPIALKILWGGDVDNDIDRMIDRDMIIVGTQDMLLSRALNRGYAMSKFRWPMHFAILNNDCLWVMDEVQLMGVGVPTSAQMQGFRGIMGTVGPTHTIWMSATLSSDSMITVDHPAKEGGFQEIQLSDHDREVAKVSTITCASKEVVCSPTSVEKDVRKYAKVIASQLVERHRDGTISLAIVNTVARAKAIYSELEGMRLETPIVLLHSHYRPPDRAKSIGRLYREVDLIVVSTQVVEAGADISSRYLLTELAPWPSMVQRFGRCNRRGEFSDALIEWVDIEVEGASKEHLPYESKDLSISRNILAGLSDGSPKNLKEINYESLARVLPTLRRKDLLGLTDTTPDLLGNDLDVSRFVRSTDSSDIYAYWRDINERPSEISPGPHPDELCSVPIEEMKRFVESNGGWIWDYVEGNWRLLTKSNARSIRPGQEILLDVRSGGYSSTKGWTGSEKDRPEAIGALKRPEQRDSQRQESSVVGKWISLTEHTCHVEREITTLSSIYPTEFRNTLELAARWHDIGKSHEAFQRGIADPETVGATIWAKSPNNNYPDYHTVSTDGTKQSRRFFRHELASALALINTYDGDDLDLAAFLVAAHHGKIRMSIRSIPSERGPGGDATFARGVWDGDILPATDITGRPICLDLSPVQFGTSSWTSRMIRLRDRPDLGPFRMAYLETVLRIADQRASAWEGKLDD